MKTTTARVQKAEIVREYGPFPGGDNIGGVTCDGKLTWAAAGTHLQAFDPETGKAVKKLPVAADAGTAFDGKHLYQITGSTIHKLDAESGAILSEIPAPGAGGDSGLAWAEGKLWVGHYRERKIYCIDPNSGKILKTIDSDRFVTGVTWLNGELWHGTWENEQSELRHVDPENGAVLERLTMPEGIMVSGLEADRKGVFYCGGGRSGKVRAVRRPTA
jgi:glutamine cyclotransferase